MSRCGAPHPAHDNITCELPAGHDWTHLARRPRGFDRWSDERERNVCSECGEDFIDWLNGDDEGVTGADGLLYCSGHCAVRAWRRNQGEHYCTEEGNAFGGYQCACGELYLTGGCASGAGDTRRSSESTS